MQFSFTSFKKFVTNKQFDFKALKEITKIITYNLNKIIDISYYHLKKSAIFQRITSTYWNWCTRFS